MGRRQEGAGSDEVLLITEVRFAPGRRDATHRGKVDDGLRNMLLEGMPNRDEIGDIDFPICTMGVVAGPAKLTHEPSSHEPGSAGDKDPHGRRLPDCGSKGNDVCQPDTT